MPDEFGGIPVHSDEFGGILVKPGQSRPPESGTPPQQQQSGAFQKFQSFKQEHPYISAAASMIPGVGAFFPEAGGEVAKGATKTLARDAYGTVISGSGPFRMPLEYASEKTGFGKKVEKATETHTPGQDVGKYATTAAEMMIPLPGTGGKLVKAGKEAIEAHAVAATNPVESIVRAIKPRATATQFKPALEAVLPEIKAAEMDLGHPIGGGPNAKPGQSVYDTIKAVQGAKAKVWAQVERYMNAGDKMGATVDFSPLAEVEKKTIPKVMRMEQPKAATAREMRASAAYMGKSGTIKEAEELLQSLNAKLQSYYSKYPTAQRSEIAKNPETAATYAKAEELRKIIYSKLNDVTGSEAVQQLKRKYGQLIEVEKGLWPRLNVVMRQSPTSLSEQISKWEGASEAARGGVKAVGAVLSGHPSLAWSAVEDFAGAYVKRKAGEWLKDANTTDTMLRRAFAKFSGSLEAIPPPVPFQPAGLLEKGATRMGPVPDASGPMPHVQPRAGTPAGYTGARALPAPSRVQQGGFAVADDLVPVRHPVTGKIEYVPKWMLQRGLPPPPTR
jgi:hypothetical protein